MSEESREWAERNNNWALIPRLTGFTFDKPGTTGIFIIDFKVKPVHVSFLGSDNPVYI